MYDVTKYKQPKNNTYLKMVSNDLPKINTHDISMHMNQKILTKNTYINTRIWLNQYNLNKIVTHNY